MSICAHCEVRACSSDEEITAPSSCPMRQDRWLDKAKKAYEEEGNRRLAQLAAHIEKTGYRRWTRLEEIGRFCGKAGYQRVGLAFCSGLRREARIVARFLAKMDLNVVSVMCKAGSVDKRCAGISEEDIMRPDEFEAMCNSIGQAELLNEEETEFNIVLGLCVGHDSLFLKYSEAPCTVLAAKDRVLGHNPLAAVYLSESYYRPLHEAPGEDGD